MSQIKKDVVAIVSVTARIFPEGVPECSTAGLAADEGCSPCSKACRVNIYGPQRPGSVSPRDGPAGDPRFGATVLAIRVRFNLGHLPDRTLFGLAAGSAYRSLRFRQNRTFVL